MYKIKLCLGCFSKIGLSAKEQIKIFNQIGFEGFFTLWNKEETAECRRLADELGLLYQSVHAPFGKIEKLWGDDENAAESVANELVLCVEDCAENNVPIMVCHVWKGFDKSDRPDEKGIKRLLRVVERAKELGVNIAFENTEGEPFLEAVMSAFKDYENVGFCLDTGHEMCYNDGKDMLSKYGDRLIATHINDNLGVRSFDGKITWLDDLHLLPFDGIKDWDAAAKRIADSGYEGPLTFELSKVSKPGRLDNLKYEKLSFEEYVTEAYARACRVAALVQKYKNTDRR